MYYPDLDTYDLAIAADRAGMTNFTVAMAPGSYIGAILHNGRAYVVSGETNTLARTTVADWRLYVADHDTYADTIGFNAWVWDDTTTLDVSDPSLSFHVARMMP